MSCPGFTLEQGRYDSHPGKSKVRKGMPEHSHQKILLLDHIKFGASAGILFRGHGADVPIAGEPLPAEREQYAQKSGLHPDDCPEP